MELPRPAQILDRMSLTAKMGLISGLFLLPILALMALLLVTLWRDLGGAEAQIEGVRYSMSVGRLQIPLMQGLKVLQVPSAQRSAADAKVLADLPGQVKKEVQDLTRLNESLRARVKTAKAFDKVRETWDHQQSLAASGTPVGQEVEFGELLSALSGLVDQVGQGASWSLDPDPTSHLLTDVVIDRMPHLADLLREMDSIASTARRARGHLGSTDHNRLTVVQGLMDQELESLDRALSLAFSRDDSGALRGSLDQQLKDFQQATDRFRNSLSELVDSGRDEGDLIDARYRQSLSLELGLWQGAGGALERELQGRQHRAQAQALLMLGLVLALLAGTLTLVVVVVRSVMRPLRDLTDATRRIVQQGDLTLKVGSGSDDEIGRLAAQFDLMVERLRSVPQGLQASAGLLGQAVEGLGQALNEQSESTVKQAAALQETQVTAQEIKQTSQTADLKAREVLQAAERADALSGQGAASLDRSLEGLMEIRSQVEDIRQRVAGLTERTREIGDIIDTVKDLADQSNMLALNAAIEAVRSGEHGKGFALVAREIRALADQSVQATAQVRQVLGSLTRAVHETVAASESGTRKIEDGLAQVRTSSDNLRSLTGLVRDDAEAVRQIASAVRQQNTGIAQIFIALTGQNQLMDEGNQRMGRSLRSLGDLRRASGLLADVVGGFKV
jgi:methyl-accepting chemotaxis protein